MAKYKLFLITLLAVISLSMMGQSKFVTVSDGVHTGVGECAPLPNLSCDDLPDYGRVLREVCDEVCLLRAESGDPVGTDNAVWILDA